MTAKVLVPDPRHARPPSPAALGGRVRPGTAGRRLDEVRSRAVARTNEKARHIGGLVIRRCQLLLVPVRLAGFSPACLGGRLYDRGDVGGRIYRRPRPLAQTFPNSGERLPQVRVGTRRVAKRRIRLELHQSPRTLSQLRLDATRTACACA